MLAEKKQFYSYLWLDSQGYPYYAGKGYSKRAFKRHGRGLWPPKDRARILLFPMISEAEAFESEIALIDLFGRKDLGNGSLINVTNGGEGASGPKTGLALKAAIANARLATEKVRGSVSSPEHNQKISSALTGRRRSAIHCKNISKAKRGKSIPKLRGVGNGRFGKVPTNIETLQALNRTRPRDARGRFFKDACAR